MLEIRTPYGDRYLIHDNGNIQRTDMAFTPSGQWRLVGLEHVRSPSRFVPLAALLAGKFPSPLHYKNGKPQWTVRDFDHGTFRTWGNTAAHGVRSIATVKG